MDDQMGACEYMKQFARHGYLLSHIYSEIRRTIQDKSEILVGGYNINLWNADDTVFIAESETQLYERTDIIAAESKNIFLRLNSRIKLVMVIARNCLPTCNIKVSVSSLKQVNVFCVQVFGYLSNNRLQMGRRSEI